MPFVPSSVLLLLVVKPGATSSFLLLVAHASMQVGPANWTMVQSKHSATESPASFVLLPLSGRSLFLRITFLARLEVNKAHGLPPSSFLLLVVRPGATRSKDAPSSDALCH